MQEDSFRRQEDNFREFVNNLALRLVLLFAVLAIGAILNAAWPRIAHGDEPLGLGDTVTGVGGTVEQQTPPDVDALVGAAANEAASAADAVGAAVQPVVDTVNNTAAPVIGQSPITPPPQVGAPALPGLLTPSSPSTTTGNPAGAPGVAAGPPNAPLLLSEMLDPLLALGIERFGVPNLNPFGSANPVVPPFGAPSPGSHSIIDVAQGKLAWALILGAGVFAFGIFLLRSAAGGKMGSDSGPGAI